MGLGLRDALSAEEEAEVADAAGTRALGAAVPDMEGVGADGLGDPSKLMPGETSHVLPGPPRLFRLYATTSTTNCNDNKTSFAGRAASSAA